MDEWEQSLSHEDRIALQAITAEDEAWLKRFERKYRGYKRAFWRRLLRGE